MLSIVWNILKYLQEALHQSIAIWLIQGQSITHQNIDTAAIKKKLSWSFKIFIDAR